MANEGRGIAPLPLKASAFRHSKLEGQGGNGYIPLSFHNNLNEHPNKRVTCSIPLHSLLFHYILL